MFRRISPETSDSDVFYVEQFSGEQSPPRPQHANFVQLHGAVRQHTQELITLSSVASPEPQIVTIDSDSNEPMMPYGFGWHLSKCSNLLEQSETAARPIQNPSNNGDSTTNSRRA